MVPGTAREARRHHQRSITDSRAIPPPHGPGARQGLSKPAGSGGICLFTPLPLSKAQRLHRTTRRTHTEALYQAVELSLKKAALNQVLRRWEHT